MQNLLNHDKGREEGGVGVALVGVADVREGILRLEEVLVVRGVIPKGDRFADRRQTAIAVRRQTGNIQEEQAVVGYGDTKAGLAGESGKEVIIIYD